MAGSVNSSNAVSGIVDQVDKQVIGGPVFAATVFSPLRLEVRTVARVVYCQVRRGAGCMLLAAPAPPPRSPRGSLHSWPAAGSAGNHSIALPMFVNGYIQADRWCAHVWRPGQELNPPSLRGECSIH